MFSYRQQSLFEKVKMVFEAPAEAGIQIVEGLGVPVRIDPAAPDARPVYDVLTSSPFRDLHQELTGAVKSWKTSHQLLNETQIMKAYAERKGIKDLEAIDLLLRSCWDRYIPGFWWAAQLGTGLLPQVIERAIEAVAYPSSAEALKVASLLPRDTAGKLFRIAHEYAKKSIRTKAKKLEPVLRARTKKYQKLIEILYPWQKLTYVVAGDTNMVTFDKVDEAILDVIIGTIRDGERENRGVFKTVESILYAPAVAELPFPREPETDEIVEGWQAG
jgi:hypothetical protein